MTDTKAQPTLPTMILMSMFRFQFDKTKDGWKLTEDVAIEGEPTLMLDTFLSEGEFSVNDHTMLERAKKGAGEKAFVLDSVMPNGCLNSKRTFHLSGKSLCLDSLAPSGVIRTASSVSRTCAGAATDGAWIGAITATTSPTTAVSCASSFDLDLSSLHLPRSRGSPKRPSRAGFFLSKKLPKI